MLATVIFVLFACIATSYGAVHQYPQIKPIPASAQVNVDPGNPLILTPYLQPGGLNITEARAKSKVEFDDFKGVTSYSGYFNVTNGNCSKNMFFWFFPAENNYNSAPVLLWLQGGPGASSLIALFTENGPFMFKSDKLHFNEYSWTTYASVLYVDNPVGTGFSFTEHDSCYVTNQEQVGDDLYQVLMQFYTMFPELKENEFYATGESYAGKYVPAIAYKIHTSNPNATLKINLQGVAIGNGLVDPVSQIQGYGDYLYQLGFIDANIRKYFDMQEKLFVNAVNKSSWKEAFDTFDNLINGDMNAGATALFKATEIVNYYNYLKADEPDTSGDVLSEYIQRNDVRLAIHVGNVTFGSQSTKVELNLLNDIPQSVLPWVNALLTRYKVLLYNGQLDIIVAYPLTLRFIDNLNLPAKNNTRHIWRVDGHIAGYAKHLGNLTEVLVRNSGHMVPRDQPKWAFDLINRFISEK